VQKFGKVLSCYCFDLLKMQAPTLLMMAAVVGGAQAQMVYVNEWTVYPGYSGKLSGNWSVAGTVTMVGDLNQTLMWDLKGLDSACVSGAANGIKNGCGIHVHTGTSCATHAGVGGHYWSPSSDPDPWLSIVYVSDGTGASVGSTLLETGLTASQLADRVFVVHELDSGARVACGKLAAPPSTIGVKSLMKYPGYTGSLVAAGTIWVAQAKTTTQVLAWDLTGLDTACVSGAGDAVKNGCGIHVHKGTSCAAHADVLGHFWSPTSAPDPWLNIVYVADASGASQGTTTVSTGLTMSQLTGKAFVVHQLTSGGRISCALLGSMAPGPGPTPAPNPAPTPAPGPPQGVGTTSGTPAVTAMTCALLMALALAFDR